jgi:hypothetical protein
MPPITPHSPSLIRSRNGSPTTPIRPPHPPLHSSPSLSSDCAARPAKSLAGVRYRCGPDYRNSVSPDGPAPPLLHWNVSPPLELTLVSSSCPNLQPIKGNDDAQATGVCIISSRSSPPSQETIDNEDQTGELSVSPWSSSWHRRRPEPAGSSPEFDPCAPSPEFLAGDCNPNPSRTGKPPPSF